MIGESKNYLYKENEIKQVRQLEPSLKPKDGPIFDPSDDPDGDEFLKANDPENRFIPIEEMPDPTACFTDLIDKKNIAGEDGKKEDDEGGNQEEFIKDIGIPKPSKNIQNYNYQRKGSKYGNLDSFHVDHETEELIAITSDDATTAEQIIIKQKNGDDIDYNNISLKGRSKGERRSMSMDAWNEEYKPARKGWDNQKTKPISEIQREKRGKIRQALDKSA